MTSTFGRDHPVSHPQQLSCPASYHGASTEHHTPTCTTALACVSSTCSPSKVKVERHRATTAAGLIWSPARDIENDRQNLSRSHDTIIRHNVNSSSKRWAYTFHDVGLQFNKRIDVIVFICMCVFFSLLPLVW